RAAELARLEHDLHSEAIEKLRYKEHLEQSIADIIQVHVQVANGNLGARVQLSGENPLWNIAVPLNNLLGRYQQALRAASERDGYQRVLSRVVAESPEIGPQATRYLREMTGAPSSLLAATVVPQTPLVFEQKGSIDDIVAS
ncbi:MAG TPA: hypothetical protein VFV38_51490, partial [Ktedonobacteraceae bacterium]|nr:hypothetical protein [Ktedonobacteraceae bacterium]